MQRFLIDISWGTIFRISIVVLSGIAVFYFAQLLWWLWAGIVIATLANVPIQFLEKYRIPRLVGVLFIYGLVLACFIFLLAIFIPSFIEEAGQLAQALPKPFNTVWSHIPINILQGETITFDKLLLGEDLSAVFSGLSRLAIQLFETFAALVFVFGIAIFISLERALVEDFLRTVFSDPVRGHALLIWKRSQQRIVGWFGVRLLGALFVGIATLVMLLLFDVSYPFMLGIVAGITDFIPFAGPVAVGMIIIGLASVDSLAKGIAVGIIFVAIQQIGESIIRPLVSKKLIGLHPILVLIFVFVGFKIGGVLGSILALPLGALILEAWRELGAIKGSLSQHSNA